MRFLRQKWLQKRMDIAQPAFEEPFLCCSVQPNNPVFSAKGKHVSQQLPHMADVGIFDVDGVRRAGSRSGQTRAGL
jgi:hypothetical protein